MEKTLIIAEKDSLGEQIAKAFKITRKSQDNGTSYYEGDNVIIAMASGHLVQRIPEEKSSNVPFLPKSYVLEPIKVKFKKLALIKKLASRKDVTEICNACDPGREGELIGWLIYSYAGNCKRYTRMWANTQTPDALRKDFAARKPSSEYQHVLNAALARHDADFKVGINTTRCLQQLMKQLMGATRMHTAGRVRTPTMAKIYDLEQKILNFKPVPYYELVAEIGVGNSNVLKAMWIHPDICSTNELEANEDGENKDESEEQSEQDELKYKITTKSNAEAIKAKSEQQPIEISVHSEEKEVSQNPPDLFDITDLTDAANAAFKWTGQQLAENLQKLYESGLVTYPRSESKFLGDDAVEDTQATMNYLLRTGYGEAEFIIKEGLVHKDNSLFNTDKLVDGHGGIVPFVPEEGVTIASFTKEQQDLYRLIVRRFISRFYPPAKFKVQTHVFTINGERYRASSRVCLEKGWRTFAKESMSESKAATPEIAVIPSALGLVSLNILEKQTQPPKRLTLGKVPKMMKRFHLGTAATRNPIVSELSAKSDAKRIPYLVVKNNLVMPTEENGLVINFLRDHNIGDLTSHELTADFEQQLDLIAKGKLSAQEFTEKLDAEVSRIVAQFQSYTSTLPEYKKLIGFCPKCNTELFDRGDRTISCSCGFTLWKNLWGVDLSEEMIQQLLKEPYRTGIVTGFYSTKAKRKFDASLRLNPAEDWKLEPVFEKQPSAEMKETSYLCPHCQTNLLLATKDETNKWLQCSSKDHKFMLRLFVAQYKLTGQDVSELLKKNYLPAHNKYVSKKGKNFAAALRMAADGSIEFEYSD